MNLDFAVRSCFSLSFLIFLTFESSIERGVTHYGRHLIGVPFSAFACILAMDQTVGGTVRNSSQVVLGSLISCVASYLALLAFEDVTIPPQGIYPLLWCYTFLLSMIDLPSLGLLGKRVGLSLITIILIPASINGTNASTSVWWLFSDVLFGCSCALVGVVLPWPRLASQELESLACRGAILVGSSFEDLLVAWRFHSLAQFQSAPGRRDAEMAQIDLSMQYPTTARTISNRHWRLLRNVYRALSAMRLGATAIPQWQQGHGRCSTRSLRQELLRVLRKDLAHMHTRAIEARYGPHFRRAQARHGAFIILLEELTLAQSTIEGRLAALTELLNSGLSLDVTKSFFSLPEFRNSLAQLGARSNECIQELGIWLSSSGHRNETLRRHSVLLTQAVSAFDTSYFIARNRCYYDNSQTVKIVPEVVLAMNSLVFYLQRFAGLLLDFCEEQLQVENQTEQHLVRDLGFAPPQRFSLTVALPQRRQLLSSLSIASSMTIAAYYGLANTRGVPFLASFTIAYLQSSTAGRNIATSLCRVGGTAAAVLYTIIIALIAQPLHDAFSERLFISFATIAFLFPCTLVRATQLAGYAGTVAGFTAALLLLAPPLETSVIVDRLIDTIVGVAIFLAFELTLSATYTERLLLEVLRTSIASLEPQFAEVVTDFVQAAQAAGTNQDSSCNRSRSRSRSRSRGTIVTQRQAQQRLQLLKLYGTEELLFNSFELTGSSPSVLLEKVFENTRLCHQHLVQLTHIAGELGRSSRRHSLAVLPIHTILESLDVPCSTALQAVLNMQQYVSTATENAPLTRSLLLVAPRIPSPALLNGLLRRLDSTDSVSPDAILLQLRACEEQTLNRFYAIAQTLQEPLQENPTGDLLPRGTEVSNLEIELTCAFLAGILDFIGALRALVPSVAELRDHQTVLRTLG